MNFCLKLISKRTTNLFVSNNCLRLFCFDVNQRFVVKNGLKISKKCYELKNQKTNDLVCGHFHSFKRCFSSKTNTFDEQSKDVSDNCDTKSGSEDIKDIKDIQLKESTKSKFKKYSDEESEVIYDVSEELIYKSEEESRLVDKEWKESDEEIYLYQQKSKQKTKSIDMSIERGVTGVFDIHQLVDLLREENIKEIAVIEVPKELDYCNYLVLGTATSKRHLNAFCEYFNKVYKIKKSRRDPFLDFGGDISPDWKVVDMKNIVLHLFLKQTRDLYDIETLWTVGYEFDDKLQKQETDSVVDIMEKHIKYLEEIKPKK